jgi:hypothetical protein
VFAGDIGADRETSIPSAALSTPVTTLDVCPPSAFAGSIVRVPRISEFYGIVIE